MNARLLMCGGLLAGLLACDQPQGYCQVAQQLGEAHFAVYTPLEPMEATCAGEELTAERMGFETYQQPGEDEIRIAWRTETLQERFNIMLDADDGYESSEDAQAASRQLNVQANYSSKPDKENRCYAFDNNNPADAQRFELQAEFEEATVTYEKSEYKGTWPAVRYEYTWRDLVVYSLPASPGQLIEGELTYSVATDGMPPCKGRYRFVALWPAYACETDEDCTPSVGGGEGAPINPDFADFLSCHPKRYCTLKASPAELIQKLGK